MSYDNERCLQEVYKYGYYGFFREMSPNEKRYAIIRKNNYGLYVLEKVYKTKKNAMVTVEKMNNRDITTIRRVSALHNPEDNQGCIWFAIPFTVEQCLSVVC